MPRRPGNKAFARRLGAFIREYRVLREMRQEELSALVGCSRTLIGAVEAGESVPSVETLFALSATLDFSIDLLCRPLDKRTQADMVSTKSWKRRALRAEDRLKRIARIAGVEAEE